MIHVLLLLAGKKVESWLLSDYGVNPPETQVGLHKRRDNWLQVKDNSTSRRRVELSFTRSQLSLLLCNPTSVSRGFFYNTLSNILFGLIKEEMRKSLKIGISKIFWPLDYTVQKYFNHWITQNEWNYQKVIQLVVLLYVEGWIRQFHCSVIIMLRKVLLQKYFSGSEYH